MKLLSTGTLLAFTACADGASLRSQVVNSLQSNTLYTSESSILVRIKGDNHILHLCEVELFDRAGNKISIVPGSPLSGANVWGSKVDEYTAKKVVDGNTANRYFDGSCMSMSGSSPWWLARYVGGPELVGKVTIYNRNADSSTESCYNLQGELESCASRLDGAIVRINNRPIAKIEKAEETMEFDVPADYPDATCEEFQFGGKKYNICKDYVTKAKAEEKCSAWGGELASVDTPEENKALIDALVEKFGCFNKDDQFDYVFWDSMYWIQNEENDSSKVPSGISVWSGKFTGYRSIVIGALCAQTDETKKYSWTDQPRHSQNSYICEKVDECAPLASKYVESEFCQSYKWSINHIKNVEGQSACDCMKACEATSGCVSFNFNEAGGCALKNRAVTSATDSKEGGPCSYSGGSYIKTSLDECDWYKVGPSNEYGTLSLNGVNKLQEVDFDFVLNEYNPTKWKSMIEFVDKDTGEKQLGVAVMPESANFNGEKGRLYVDTPKRSSPGGTVAWYGGGATVAPGSIYHMNIQFDWEQSRFYVRFSYKKDETSSPVHRYTKAYLNGEFKASGFANALDVKISGPEASSATIGNIVVTTQDGSKASFTKAASVQSDTDFCSKVDAKSIPGYAILN